MAEETKVVDYQEVPEEEVEEIKESKFQKVKTFAKTKGKKIAAVAAIGGAAAGGFILAKVLSRETNEEGMPIVETEWREVEESTEE